MKSWMLAALLAITQAPSPIPRKVPDHHACVENADRSDETPTVQTKSTKKAVSAEGDKTESANPESKNAEQSVRIRELPPVAIARDWADWGYWAFSGFLVLVGILQVLLLLGTLRAVRRQVDLMGRQTGVLEDSVAAAKASVEMFISKERPRIRIDLKPLSLRPKTLSGVYTVDFTVSIHGATAAYLFDSGCVAMVLPLEYIVSEDFGSAIMFPFPALPTVIRPDAAPIEEFAIFQQGTEGVDAVISEIKKNRMSVGIRGFVKYRDVFDRERETRFRYVWKYSAPWLGEEFGNWEKCGADAENNET